MKRNLTQKFILTLLLLFGVLGSAAVFADDPYPSVPPFAEGVQGIVLLNGAQGAALRTNGNIIRYLNDYTLKSVMALNISVHSAEEARMVRDHYNADMVVWHETDGAATRLNIAAFPRADQALPNPTGFAPNLLPTTVSVAFHAHAAEQSATFLYALEKYRSMDYYEAEITFTTVILTGSASDDLAAVYMYRGFARLMAYDLEGFIADFDQIPATSDLAAYAAYHRGNAHYSNWQYLEATEDYTQVITSGEMPLLHFAYATRGYLRERAEEFDPAIADYTSAIELDNTNADVYLHRAMLYYNQTHYEAALQDYDRLLALSPSNLTNWQRRGMVYVRMGDYDHAIEDYTTSIVLANENNILCQCLYAHRGAIYYIAGKLELAEADYAKSLTYGETAAAHVGLAYVYTDMGKTADAQHEMELAEALSNSGDYLTLGEGYEHLGDAQTAGEKFWQWISMNQAESITEPTKSLMSPAELSLTAGRVFYVPVTLKADETLNVRTFGDTELLDTLIVILDNHSNPVAGSDDRVIGKDNNAEVEFTAKRAGKYTVVVTHAGGISTGMFTLAWNVK